MICSWHLCENETPKEQKFCSSKCKNKYHVIVHRRRLKERAVAHAGGKCERCGYDKYVGALEFHHRDPTQKDFSVGTTSKGWDTIKEEVEKCMLLCANCHREVHAEEKGLLASSSVGSSI